MEHNWLISYQYQEFCNETILILQIHHYICLKDMSSNSILTIIPEIEHLDSLPQLCVDLALPIIDSGFLAFLHAESYNKNI